jgi:hypothetical protein
MFQDNELKIKLYIYSVLFFALGTVGLLNPGWEIFGAVLFALGFVVSLHVIIVSVIREGRHHIQADENRIAEQRKLYETIMRMSAEEKYIFGLGYTPKEVVVKKDKTSEVGNEFSQTWKKIPLAPYKLKVVAQAAINGEGFTVRKWVGTKEVPGLLSRGEWDAAHEVMEKLGMLEPVGNDPREGFMWTSFGEDVLAQIVKDSL